MVDGVLLLVFSLLTADELKCIRLNEDLVKLKSNDESSRADTVKVSNSIPIVSYELRQFKVNHLSLLEYGVLPDFQIENAIVFRQKVQFENIILGILAQRPDLLPHDFLNRFASGYTLDARGMRILERLKQYTAIILEAAALNNLDPLLIMAIITQESAGRADAVSYAGAKGLMQLMDATAAILGVSDSFDPYQNIMGGAKYIREQFDRFQNWEHAIAAYNAGPGNVKKYNGIPPFKETQNYVKKSYGILARIPIQSKHD